MSQHFSCHFPTNCLICKAQYFAQKEVKHENTFYLAAGQLQSALKVQILMTLIAWMTLFKKHIDF